MFGKKTELAVGIFLIIGILSLFFLSIKLGKVELFDTRYYSITALFDSITGLKKGASVEIAGVPVGKVSKITMKDYMALVEMSILKGNNIPDDSIASIRTKGVIGDKFVKLSPGGSEENFQDGDNIFDTESAISLEELISKYIFDK